jgi:hypothetical protein
MARGLLKFSIVLIGLLSSASRDAIFHVDRIKNYHPPTELVEEGIVDAKEGTTWGRASHFSQFI